MPINLFDEAHDEMLESELLSSAIYRVQAEIVPGGYGDGDVLTKSKKETLAYLYVRNHVIEGPHKGAVVYDRIMVEPIGTSTDGEFLAVKRGRARVRRIVESARAVDVDHEPVEKIRERLAINGWSDVHGLTYFAKVGVEEANGTYKAKNIIEHIVTPTDTDWPGTPTTPPAPVRPLVITSAKDEMNDEIPY
jgi:hypothetical protein